MTHVRVRPLHFLLIGICGLLCIADSATAQCQYEVTAIIEPPPCPPPFTQRSLIATAINNHGHVVGYYEDCVTLIDEGVLWTPDEGLTVLPRPTGVLWMQPEDINDHGVICGTWGNSNVPGSRRGFVYWPDTQTYTELDTQSGAGWGMAHAINNNNVVVGERSTTAKAGPRIAYSWSKTAGFDDLGLNSESSASVAISESNLIVGRYVKKGESNADGFIYDGQSVTDITPASASSRPRSVTRLGTVGGSSTLGVGFIWHEGESVLILPVDDDHISNVVALNELGHALVRSRNSDRNTSRSFFWVDGTYLNAQDLLPDESLLIVEDPIDLNDPGQFVVEELGGKAILFSPLDRPYTDLTADCQTNRDDLVILLELWGAPSSATDFNDDGRVNVFDLLILLANWG